MTPITLRQSKKSAPSPPGNFFLGHLPQLWKDPLGYPTRCAREYGDVVRLQVVHIPVYLLSHPSHVECVLVTHNHSFAKGRVHRVSRRLLGGGLLTSEGDYWLRQRRLVQPAFHLKRIEAYGEVMVAYTERMLAGWQNGQRRNLHADLTRLTLEIVSKALFGAEVAGDAKDAAEALNVFFSENAPLRALFLLPESIPTPRNLRFRHAGRRLETIIYRIIRQRRQRGEDSGDLLSALLYARDKDGTRMTDRQLRDEMMTLFIAGHETTANALAWTLYLLTQHPEAERRLVSELSHALAGRAPTVADLPKLRYCEQVVLESLRLYPPSWAIGRRAVRDCEIDGYLIPAGTSVVLPTYAIQRDARHFEEPDAFHPERWSGDSAKRPPRYAYIPFGAGPRVCVGEPFALVEAVLLLAAIVQRFQFQLVPGHTVRPMASLTLRPKDGVWAVVSRRRTNPPFP